jgi:CubicO group peptidase (beta-lactamase class C family)
MTDEKVPGVSIALVDRDGILWAAGFGYTDMNQEAPVTMETIFGMASITKVFTATAVMFAIQDGVVELDVPIIEYLSDFSVNSRFEEKPQEKITLRHLLTHTSGLTHDTTVGNLVENKSASFEDHIKSISNTWLRHRVGERILYSNIGMDLAAYVLQVRTGKPYGDFLRESVFKPMNMSNSSTDLTFIRRHPNRATGRHPHVKEISLEGVNFHLGAGSMFTNARDLARYIQFHLNRGRVDQRPVLDERFIDIMYTPSPLLNPGTGVEGNHDQALGIGIYTSKEGIHRLAHNGGGMGFVAFMYWYPEYGIGALIMGNSLDFGNRGGALIYSIGQRIVSEKLVERNKFFDGILWKTVWNNNSNESSVGRDPDVFTPYRPAWAKYEGTYRYMWGGYKPYAYAKVYLAFAGAPQYEVQVRDEDGYLEIEYQGLSASLGKRLHERLDEYQPGLFFTKQGECLDLRGEIPTWQNYRLDKTK